MQKSGNKLIRYLFICSFSTFFLSMLTFSLGSLVDGLVIGNTMKTNAVAAFGLINPLNFIFAIIVSVLNSGSETEGRFFCLVRTNLKPGRSPCRDRSCPVSKAINGLPPSRQLTLYICQTTR
ncbi:MAG: hypothetical protein IKH81_04175 [Clostridia bacterium]|nr:hypothetical protein [Clostridia bacterium]